MQSGHFARLAAAGTKSNECPVPVQSRPSYFGGFRTKSDIGASAANDSIEANTDLMEVYEVSNYVLFRAQYQQS